ncbi:MAG: histidine kinase dimerization/phospho-acceptor domain-containing protein [Candidatus Omnitrophota bacterium]
MEKKSNENASACQGDEKAADEYFAYVRHELLNRLAVIREATSLIKDGIIDKNTEMFDSVLEKGFNKIIELNKLIEDLLRTTVMKEMTAQKREPKTP